MRKPILLLPLVSHKFEYLSQNLLSQYSSIRLFYKPHKINPSLYLINRLFILVQIQFQSFFQKSRQILMYLIQLLRVFVQNNKIIHISAIILTMPMLFYILIQYIQINITKKLACQISDRQTL